jgi:hypothetical protein
MDEPVKYKKPSRINVVSVTLALALAVGAVLAWRYVPLFLLKQEVYRVLEETGSTFSGRKGFYLQDEAAREELRAKMERELRALGIEDPAAETWIEIDGRQVRLGIAYGTWVEWPLDVVPRSEQVYEVEHVVVVD